MHRYLLFDSGCSLCSGLATDIAAASNGLLTTRSLRDPEMQAALKHARPEWRWEPTLLEVQGEDVHVFTGFALRAQLLTVLGPRRAWRVAQLVARAQTSLGDIEDESRRAVIRRGAAMVTGVVGVALLGPGTAKAQSESVVASGAGRRPGRLSCKEGITSWRVTRKPTGAVVAFQHRDRKRSGVLEYVLSDGGKTATFTLRRNNRQSRVASSPFRGTLSGVDARGRQFTSRLNWQRKRWEMDAQSERVLRESEWDFKIGFPILVDLEGPRPQAASLRTAEGGVAALATCSACDESNRQGGSGAGWWRSTACEDATKQVNENCSFGSCSGCCRLIGPTDDCDCFCAIGDFSCGCDKLGYPCVGPCF